MPLTIALCRVQPSFFEKQPLSAEIALRAVKSIDDLVRRILESESPTLAGRLGGAYQFLGDAERAEQILGSVRAAGFVCEPENPFDKPVPILTTPARLTFGPCWATGYSGLFIPTWTGTAVWRDS